MIAHELSSDKRVRRISMSGSVSSKEFLDYRQEIVEMGNPLQIASFVDFEGLSDVDFGFTGVHEHVGAIAKMYANRPQEFTEIIFAPSDLAYGLARMYQTLASGAYNVLIFRDADAAQESLANVLAASSSPSNL